MPRDASLSDSGCHFFQSGCHVPSEISSPIGRAGASRHHGGHQRHSWKQSHNAAVWYRRVRGAPNASMTTTPVWLGIHTQKTMLKNLPFTRTSFEGEGLPPKDQFAAPPPPSRMDLSQSSFPLFFVCFYHVKNYVNLYIYNNKSEVFIMQGIKLPFTTFYWEFC